MMKNLLLALSALAPIVLLLGGSPDTMIFVYTIFVGVYFVTQRFGGLVLRAPKWRYFLLLLLFLLSGLITETLAWLSDYLAGEEIPVTFHPQLIPDLILGLGFYGGLGVAWCIALRWFRFSLLAVFIISGIYGVFIEQSGAVFVQIVQMFTMNPLVAIMLGIYLFIVYGSIVGIAYSPMEQTFRNSGKSSHLGKYPLIFALIFLLPNLGFALVYGITELLGGLPEPKSALEFPLW